MTLEPAGPNVCVQKMLSGVKYFGIAVSFLLIRADQILTQPLNHCQHLDFLSIFPAKARVIGSLLKNQA